jgi:RNA:NAD 2'-phosphotransferase (TPT1/KptA family)
MLDMLTVNICSHYHKKYQKRSVKETMAICLNTEKTKYMLLSRHQNAGQNHDIKIGNRSFENVSQFRYLGTTITNQNLIQEEIKRRLNSGNACYHSVQNHLSSRLLSKNIKIRIASGS